MPDFNTFKTMKTIIHMLTIFLVVNSAIIFANTTKPVINKPVQSAMTMQTGMIDPVRIIPSGVESTDGTDVGNAAILVAKLAPVTPAEADFEDTIFPAPVEISALAPTPHSAPDFEDAAVELDSVAADVAPSTPVEADFLD